MHRHVLAGVAALGLVLLAAPAANAATNDTNFNASNFGSTSTTIDNPWLPFPSGTTYHFTGVVDKKSSTDTVGATGNTPTIDGVKARAVHDEVAVNNKVIEKTDDFYAQDKQGNVWYMGEDSFELQNGKFVLASDSWKAGVNGAKPGIIQEANPKVGDSYTEENAPGVAEDQAKVLSLNATVNDVPYCDTAPSGTCDNLLETVETSPLDPQSENKWYARGVGEVKEAVADGSEHYELVSITH
jgi:hypothetical protein